MQTSVTGWLEAFAAHPKIGDVEGLRKKFGAFANMSKGEQAAGASASEQTLRVSRKGLAGRLLNPSRHVRHKFSCSEGEAPGCWLPELILWC
jgi:hypothetical protein